MQVVRVALHVAVRKIGTLLKRVGDILHGVAQRIYSKPVSVRDANVRRWYATPGTEHGLRYEFDMSPDDVVLDVGGFEGEWAAEMAVRYGCHVHICEPITAFVERLRRRFGTNPRITIHPVGLGARDEARDIFIMSESSSVLRQSAAYHPTSVPETIRLRNVVAFLAECGMSRVAVMKINIEGGEYDLLDALIASGRITDIDNILVQFHDFIADAEERVARIRDKLRATHEQTFAYDFVWENWKRL